MLIDSGGLSSDRFDTGESIVAPALMALGIRRVNWLVISHPHHDHMAGMPYVLEYFQPEELWVPMEEYPDPFFNGIVRSARRKGLTVRTSARGTAPLSIDGVVVEILSPDATQAETAQAYHDLNDSSLVMKISYGRHAFLFSGDISVRQEQVLLERDLDIRAKVLKVPHHGKRSSSSQAFLDEVDPERAIFSCRAYAGSDLPTDVLNRYRSCGIQTLRTDVHGAIQITSNGTQLETYTFMPHREFRPW
jgi:competence protein ComEC